MIFSFLVLFIVNVLQKLLVNQEEAKKIKEEVKELGNQMKEEQKQGNSTKATELMKEMMSKNSKMMSMTMRPMLVSFVVIILILPWLSGHYGDKMIALQDSEGNITIGSESYTVQKSYEDLLVMKGGTTIFNVMMTASEDDRSLEIDGNWYVVSYEEAGGFILTHPEQMKLSRVVAFLPVTLPYFGNNLGWLGWYLILSVPVALIIRRALKISV
jgi:uncharacterized membrane protein (DUF106 family)